MPTPFTHLKSAEHLLADDTLPVEVRAALDSERGAFLLGNVAADARTGADLKREATHFYAYDKGISEHPWRVMMQQHPGLATPHSAAQRAFLAGYVAHLSMDEVWSLDMLGPHFAGRDWAPWSQRFIMLHVLLIHMDERDLAALAAWQHPALASAVPQDWVPFMSDSILSDWRDFVADQIKPGGESQTLQVFGSRIGYTPEDLRAILDAPERMDADLWTHITPEVLAEIEAAMNRHAREQMLVYWSESGG